MSQDDIISMAQEAGFMQHLGVIAVPGIHCLERFAELVVAAEREACAKLFYGPVWSYDYREIAAAIRARS